MGNYYFCNIGREQQLSNSAYKVYHILSSMANKEGTSFLSKSYLATRAGISKSSVYNATKELAALGLIKITERFKKSVGQQTSNLYTILKSPPTVEKPIKRLRIERSVSHKLSSGSLRIYCFLKAHTAKDGICGIHLRHIAKHIGRSTRTVQRYLKSMVEKGILKVFHDKGKKSYYQVKNASSGYTETESVQIYKNDNSANQDHAIYPPLLVIAEQFGASLRLLV